MMMRRCAVEDPQAEMRIPNRSRRSPQANSKASVGDGSGERSAHWHKGPRVAFTRINICVSYNNARESLLAESVGQRILARSTA